MIVQPSVIYGPGDHSDVGTLLNNLAALYRAGCDVRLEAVYDVLEARSEGALAEIQAAAGEQAAPPLPLLVTVKSSRTSPSPS